MPGVGLLLPHCHRPLSPEGPHWPCPPQEWAAHCVCWLFPTPLRAQSSEGCCGSWNPALPCPSPRQRSPGFQNTTAWLVGEGAGQDNTRKHSKKINAGAPSLAVGACLVLMRTHEVQTSPGTQPQGPERRALKQQVRDADRALKSRSCLWLCLRLPWRPLWYQRVITSCGEQPWSPDRPGRKERPRFRTVVSKDSKETSDATR